MKIIYTVTGVDSYGKRFKLIHTSLAHVLGINLWNGSVWRNTNRLDSPNYPDEKAHRILIKRVCNGYIIYNRVREHVLEFLRSEGSIT